MSTLFPTQNPVASVNSEPATSSEPEKSATEVIQRPLIHYLIECALLESWVDERTVTTTTTDYWSNLTVSQTQALSQSLAALSHSYLAFFIQDNPLLVVQMDDDRQLLLPVASAYAAPWRLHKSCLPMLYDPQTCSDTGGVVIEPIKTAQLLLDIFLSMMDSAALLDTGIVKLKQSLDASFAAQQQSATADISLSVYGQRHWYQTLIAGEQWASLMDRPFHPLAKSKLGFSAVEYDQYMAEFNQPIHLMWVAIAKSHLMVAERVKDISTQHPAAYLLDDRQQQQLTQEMVKKTLLDTHVAVPVHPWQMTHVIDALYKEEFASGTAVLLNFEALITYASASMRSMLINTDTPNSIKLPIGVYALNSKRYLPALKLINGEKNQKILMQARDKDALLAAQLRLWDERLWWGFMPPAHLEDKSAINPYFYQEKPTHLGAMLRQLPADLCHDATRLLPMASLGMLVHSQGSSHHVFDELIETHQSRVGAAQIDIPAVAKQYFTDVCRVFLGTMLRCLRLGFAPEMHGQNIVIVLQDNRFTGLLLRDHDSVRIHLPWLKRHEIADPEYLSPPDFKNRLYRETPQSLIFYLQSLGLLVNIRAIIESLVEHYGLDEASLWYEVRLSIEQALDSIDFDGDQRQIIRHELLDSVHYPHKTLLLPVIERGSDPHGSMPAGESKTKNPLYGRQQTPQDTHAHSKAMSV